MRSSIEVQTYPENHQSKRETRSKKCTIKGQTEKLVIAVNMYHKKADFLSTIKGRTEKSIVPAEESIEATKISKTSPKDASLQRITFSHRGFVRPNTGKNHQPHNDASKRCFSERFHLLFAIPEF